VASKKRESKSDRKRAKLEKRRKKLEKKLREIEERLKETGSKPSKIAPAGKPKRHVESGAARSASKPAKRPLQKVEPAPRKAAKKVKKPAPAAKHRSQSAGRPKRARRVPSASGVPSTPESTARFPHETSPAEVFPQSNTASE
jgi:hypothetical protein